MREQMYEFLGPMPHHWRPGTMQDPADNLTQADNLCKQLKLHFRHSLCKHIEDYFRLQFRQGRRPNRVVAFLCTESKHQAHHPPDVAREAIYVDP